MFLGTLRSFWEEIKTHSFNTYNIKEVIIQSQGYYFFHKWINKLLVNKVPKTLFQVIKVAGSTK